jgi:long-chain acyl-CoA synthetase
MSFAVSKSEERRMGVSSFSMSGGGVGGVGLVVRMALVVMATTNANIRTTNAFSNLPWVTTTSTKMATGSSKGVTAATPTLVSLRATIEEETTQRERMTEEDEDILFGDDATPHPPFPMPHHTKDKFGNVLSDHAYKMSPLDHAEDPLVNKLRTMRDTIQFCPQIWEELAVHCPEKRAIIDEHLCDDKIDLNFQQMHDTVLRAASVFQSLGVKRGTKVAVLGENSARWLMVDHGIQLAGGISAVRGADAPADELRYIYEHSDSAGIAVLQGPKLLKKLAKDAKAKKLSNLGLANESHGPVQTIILMHREKASDADIALMAAEYGVQIEVFADMVAKASLPANLPTLTKKDTATIVYTSGTTGRPKVSPHCSKIFGILPPEKLFESFC